MTNYWENTLDKLLKAGSIQQGLIQLFDNRQFQSIIELLAAYQYHNALLKEDSQSMFSDLYAVTEKLANIDQYIFLSLCEQSLSLKHSSYTFNEDDYQKLFIEPSRARGWARDAEQQATYTSLSSHPFIKKYQDFMRYLPREKALSVLQELWSTGRKKEFLYVYDALNYLQNSQQRDSDPQFTEETLSDQIAAHPGLELVILNVSRQSLTYTDNANLPQLRVIASNAPVPFEESNLGDTSAATPETPDFWILTSDKTYTSLHNYLRDSLAEQSESKGYGPYRYDSKDDRGYATAAALLAKSHDYLRVPNNFTANAQQRVRREIASVQNKAFGNVYAHRFLRTQKWSPWAAALMLASGSAKALESTTFYEAEKELVTHGFSHAADRLSHMARTDEERIDVYQGLKDGIAELHEHLNNLADSSDHITPSLNWYEQIRGFNPDIMYLPVSDRKKLAYKDVSDIMLAALTGERLNKLYRNKCSDARQGEILSQIPINTITDMYVKAGDVTGFMRLYNHLKRVDKSEDSYFKSLESRIKKSGFYIFDNMVIRDLGGLPFTTVIDNRNGAFWIKTDKMIHFKTPEQIVGDQTFSDAVAAHCVLSSLKFSEEFRNKQAEQLEQLKSFIEEVIAAQELTNFLKKEGIPEATQKELLAVTRSLLPDIKWEQLPDDARVGTSDEFEKAKPFIERIYTRAGGQMLRPTFARVVEASRSVSSLFQRRPKKSTPDVS